MDTIRVRGEGGRRRLDLAGDRGYSCLRVRAWFRRRGIEAAIPTRSDPPRERLDVKKYRERNAVDRCIGWLEGCRRLATRYEKLATSFLAVVTLVMIQRRQRLLDPTNRN